MGEVVDMFAAKRRKEREKTRQEHRLSKKTKIAAALAEWGNLSGTKALERNKNLFKKVEEDDQFETFTD